MFDSLFSLFTILLSLFGISFLIFIHELGHYLAARFVGVKVEVFSIGFGKPLYQWKRGEEVWQIGALPFGGYVRMAGMETEGQKEFPKGPGTFFSKGPWSRLLVVSAGPFVNIAFAFLVFAGVWAVGGWEHPFSKNTHVIGWVDPQSELYKDGLRPGDLIESYSGIAYRSSVDNVQGPTLAGDTVEVDGYHINKDQKTPFKYNVATYDDPQIITKGIKTAGILAPASYLVYEKLPDGQDNPLPTDSSISESGLQYGDRLYWADGAVLYSRDELLNLVSNHYALVTILRNGETSTVRVPRVHISELKLSANQKEELRDWQHLEGFPREQFAGLYFIPFNLDDRCTVESPLALIDPDKIKGLFLENSDFQKLLQPGDRILAIDGTPVTNSHELLRRLQKRAISIIVERTPQKQETLSWKEADQQFIAHEEADQAAIQRLASSIGSTTPSKQEGKFVLLKPVEPMKKIDVVTDSKEKTLLSMEWQEQRKKLEEMSDPDERAQALAYFDKLQNQLVLGVNLQDHEVWYRPSPTTLFYQVTVDIKHTLSSLFTGNLSPKFMSGPIGIIQVMQSSWKDGFRDALFWLGAISLNLGLLNLLPIPVLDGGYILFSLWEIITRRPLSPKALERLIFPFAVLLITLMILLVFNDVRRLLPDFSSWF